jgi:hypothetical protein
LSKINQWVPSGGRLGRQTSHYTRGRGGFLWKKQRLPFSLELADEPEKGGLVALLDFGGSRIEKVAKPIFSVLSFVV